MAAHLLPIGGILDSVDHHLVAVGGHARGLAVAAHFHVAAEEELGELPRRAGAPALLPCAAPPERHRRQVRRAQRATTPAYYRLLALATTRRPVKKMEK